MGFRPEDATDARDVHLDRLDRAERQVVRPQAVRQELRRDRSISLKDQERKHAPLARAAEIERMPVGEYRDIAEEAELKAHASSGALSGAYANPAATRSRSELVVEDLDRLVKVVPGDLTEGRRYR